jgi:hypothetical protein
MNEAYVLMGVGTVISVVGFLVVQLLNGIRSDIVEIKNYLYKIENDLHSRVNEVDRRHSESLIDIDRRVSKVEARCAVVHQGQQ